MDFSVYTNQLKDKISKIAKSYLKEEVALATNERCCISFTDKSLSVLKVSYENGITEVQAFEKIQFESMKSLALILRGLIDRNNLSVTPIYWVLGPDDYQINLIESMPVPANEIRTALSWRIRSLINYPIDEAVLEYFQLPAKKTTQHIPIIGAVTAKKSLLQPVVNLLKDTGLNLVNIDIPELAILNLTSLYETDEKCTAFLYFYEKTAILNISSQKVLYFTRRINIPFTAEGGIDYEKLSLEILRYFDFSRSQWRLSQPNRIFAATENGDINFITKALSERLLNTVSPYVLNSPILSDEQKQKIDANYLLDYGCLLKKDVSDVTPRD